VGLRLAAWSGWLAAAACLAIAIGVAARRTGPTDPARAREQFLETASDAATAPWGEWDSPEQRGVAGEVVWSESAQRGYMTFRGLGPNDPTEEQYQLWIIDERGLEQRISGGVFDSDADGEVVVEIEPAVEIRGAAAFAVTIERPGGVWVSDMSRRVVIAALPGSGG
jgi:anti-sigma-K factor RskA